MSYTYSFDHDRNLVICTYDGSITAEDVIANSIAILADPAFRPGMNAYCDYSGASVAWSLGELDRFRQFVSRIKHQTGKCRWAVIFPHGRDASTARLFITLHNVFEATIRVKLFTVPEAAMEWLLEPVEQKVSR